MKSYEKMLNGMIGKLYQKMMLDDKAHCKILINFTLEKTATLIHLISVSEVRARSVSRIVFGTAFQHSQCDEEEEEMPSMLTKEGKKG